MSIPDLIRARGFRRWYERELIRSHAHLVLLVLAAVGVFGALEAFSLHGGTDRLLMVASLLAAAAVGVWALRRYLFHLMRAEAIAGQAVCAGCQAYGLWRIERAEDGQETGNGSDDGSGRMAVCCRKCGHRWHIDW